MSSADGYSRQFASQFPTQGKFGVMEPRDLDWKWIVLHCKMLPNVDFDDILFGECIYSCLIMGNTVVILPGLVGAGTLSPGVGPRALKW